MTDYTTLEAIRTRRKIVAAAEAAFDTRWADLPTAVSRWLDAQCNRRLYRDADEVRAFDPFFAVDGRCLWLEHDLAAVTDIAVDGAVVADTEYVLEPHLAPFDRIWIRRASSASWMLGSGDEGSIQVNGRWCMLPDGDERYALVQEAALVLALFAVDHGDAGAFQTIVIPESGFVKLPDGFPPIVMSMIYRFKRLPY